MSKVRVMNSFFCGDGHWPYLELVCGYHCLYWQLSLLCWRLLMPLILFPIGFWGAVLLQQKGTGLARLGFCVSKATTNAAFLINSSAFPTMLAIVFFAQLMRLRRHHRPPLSLSSRCLQISLTFSILVSNAESNFVLHDSPFAYGFLSSHSCFVSIWASNVSIMLCRCCMTRLMHVFAQFRRVQLPWGNQSCLLLVHLSWNMSLFFWIFTSFLGKFHQRSEFCF